MKPVTLVTPTRGDAEYFAKTALGRTVGRLGNRVNLHAIYNNTDSIAHAYNSCLTNEHRDEIIVLIHDDVSLEDYWVAQRVNEALVHYDMVGLVGQSYPPPAATWDSYEGHKDCMAHWDLGTVAMGTQALGSTLDFYKKSPAPSYLIDGMFMALNTQRVLDAGARFDEQYTCCGYYDLDFSRTCTKLGLSIGVWPIVATHKSMGTAVGSEAWNRELELYKEKWNRG